MVQPKYVLFSFFLILMLLGESGFMQRRKRSWTGWWMGFQRGPSCISSFKNNLESHFSFFLRVPHCLNQFLLLGRQFKHTMYLLSTTFFSYISLKFWAYSTLKLEYHSATQEGDSRRKISYSTVQTNAEKVLLIHNIMKHPRTHRSSLLQ